MELLSLLPCNGLVYKHVQKISFPSLNATIPMKHQKYLLRTNLTDSAELEQTVVQNYFSGRYTPDGRLNIPGWPLMGLRYSNVQDIKSTRGKEI